MSIGLVTKLALMTTMVIVTSIWGDGGAIPVGGGCPYDDAYRCCIYACQHDHSTGCNGGSRCCENLCA